MKKRVGTAFGASLFLPVVSVAVWMLRPFDDASRWVALFVYACGWGALFFAVQRHRKTLARVERGRRTAKSFLLDNARPLVATLGLVAAAWALVILVPPSKSDFIGQPAADLVERLERDLGSVEHSRHGLERALAEGGALFGNARAASNADDKAALLSAWMAYLDHSIELDRLIRSHQYFYQINPVTHIELNTRSFLAGYSALAAQMLAAERLRAAVQGKREIETLLNEPRPELGVPKAAYFRLKQHLSRPDTWLRLHAGRAHLEVVKVLGHFKERERALAKRASEEYVDLARRLGKRPDVLYDNPLDYLERVAFVAWYPLQKTVSESMGDTRTTRRPPLIGADAVASALPRMEPGDILIERRNWYLSNIGLPGFWPHAALFVGTPAEFDAYFSEVDRSAISGEAPSAYVSRIRPDLSRTWGRKDEHGDAVRVLEAISEGVSLTSFEHSAGADYVAVLRPRLERRDKLAAVVRAFTHFGKPYDFDFDFVTDHAVVCSELVYKAYQARAGEPGIPFDLAKTSGRWVLSPNDIVRKFDAEHGTRNAALDFVLFLDGQEKSRSVVLADAAALRASWRRPKWDIFQP